MLTMSTNWWVINVALQANQWMILYKIDTEKLTWWPDLTNCSTAPSHHSGSISGHHQALCCQSSTPSPCNCCRFGDICHPRGDICRSPFHDPGAADRPSSHATSGHTALVLSRCSSGHGSRLGRRDQRRGWRKLLCHKQRCSAKNSQQNVKVLFTILWLPSQKKHVNQLKDKTFKGIAKEAYFSNVLHNIPFVQKTLSQRQHFEESIFGSFVQRTLISLNRY